MRSLLGIADLKAINETKLQEFKDSLVQNVQESIGDIDVATSSLEEEQLHNLESAVLRLRMVFPQMDIRDIYDGDDESEQTGLWETVLAIADRGKLGYREEVKVCLPLSGTIDLG
jgi:cohesin complex subunit SA-1/2